MSNSWLSENRAKLACALSSENEFDDSQVLLGMKFFSFLIIFCRDVALGCIPVFLHRLELKKFRQSFALSFFIHTFALNGL